MADPTPNAGPRPYRTPPPPPHPKAFHRWTGIALGASMWFWLMYRAKKDGPVLLGWKKPWEH